MGLSSEGGPGWVLGLRSTETQSISEKTRQEILKLIISYIVKKVKDFRRLKETRKFVTYLNLEAKNGHI